MRLIQLLPTIVRGDAVSNHTRALLPLLRRRDPRSMIYAVNIGEGIPRSEALPLRSLPALGENDTVIYHLSTGAPECLDVLEGLRCRRIMVYHNITPAHFAAPYSPAAEQRSRLGEGELRRMRGLFCGCIADSEYNKRQLLNAGYTCPIHVCPILIPWGDYDREPDARVLRKYADDRTTILFVGRIAPNKRQDALIRAFAAYQQLFDPTARLILAGSVQGMENYHARLVRYTRTLGVRDVIFTGSIPFAELLSLYRRADLFVCPSEHEGFCVPLPEAMHFGVPVLARAAAAVPETLGEGGELIEGEDPREWAECFHALLTDAPRRAALIAAGHRRERELSQERVAALYENALSALLAAPLPPELPRVFQAVPVLSRGDAVSADLFALHELLQTLPCRAGIWTLECPEALRLPGMVVSETPPVLRETDIVIFHMAMGADMADSFLSLPCRKVMIYHNITPPEFFERFSPAIAEGCRRGLAQTRAMAEQCECCFADSEYNRQELLRLGSPRRSAVLPLLIAAEDYQREADAEMLRRLSDGRHSILFVGRIVPNKAQEDVIRAFACYRERYDSTARLILAGNADTLPAYTAALRSYIRSMGLEEAVLFPGKLSFTELLACYARADAFLCLSRHEGFCVPLFEAMLFDVPVAALAVAAVPETLGGAGVLLDSAEPETVAVALHRLMDGAEREKLLALQRERRRAFLPETTRPQILAALSALLEEA